MAKQRHLTKWTVQEALNKEHYTSYAAVYDDSIDLSGGFALASAQDFPAGFGATSIFAELDPYGKKLIYSKVSVDSGNAIWIKLADKNGNLGDPIYVLAALSPITFTGYDITDLSIKTTGGTDTLGITAWR